MHDLNHYDHVGRTNTGAGARTGLFVSGLNRLFVAVPHRGSQMAKLLVYEITKPPERMEGSSKKSLLVSFLIRSPGRHNKER
jgi:hypothetical protein